jgi:hypothetical protein
MSRVSKIHCIIDKTTSFVLKDGADLESIVAPFQRYAKGCVLCVEDGTYLAIYPESGPFPFPLQFDYKQKRNGIVEYYFRANAHTEEETLMCVFGRENAEIFCKNYTDGINTSSEEISEDPNPEDASQDSSDEDSEEEEDDETEIKEPHVSTSEDYIQIDPSVTHLTLLPPSAQYYQEETYVL